MAIYLSNRDGNGKTSEEGHYRLQTRILKGVVLKTNDLRVTQTSPLSLGVLITSGDYRIETPEGYAYTGWLTTDETRTLTTANTTNPRISVVVIYVDKTVATTSSMINNPGVTKIVVIDGTPAASPIAPNTSTIQAAIGNNNPFAILAEVRVNANATTVNDSNITDTRVKIGLIDDILANSNIGATIGPSIYPIDSLYINTTNATNPSTLLGFGTWEAFGAGRVPVGIDSTQTEFDTIGETGGTKTVALTEPQLPNISGAFTIHGQEGGTVFYNRSGYTTGGTYGGYKTPPGTTGGASSVTNPGFNFGQNQPHNNLQPYVVVYMWRRTA